VAVAWAPSLTDVGERIPTRTRDVNTPGSDALLNTFTASTTPTGDQAQGFLDKAVDWVVAAVGDLPGGGADQDELYAAAADAATWRAAADIELAYPNRDADIRLADQLDRRAKDALAMLRSALATETGGGPVELVPLWQSPAPVPWGDDLLM
jgi:hypothetical protein